MPTDDSPKRILRVIARLNMGGPALHVAYLTAGLESRGYRTTLVAGELARGESSMAFVAEDLGVRVLPLTQLHRDVSVVRDAVATFRLARLIRSERPDIVHTHTAKAGAVGRVAALLAGGRRRPLVVHTFHGHVLRGYFGPLRTTAFRLLETLLARWTDALVAVSPQVRDDLVALGIAPAEKFAVVRLGIELERRVAAEPGAREETRRLLGVADGRFVIGWVGRMTGVKRTEDVLLALRRLREGGTDAALCMIGDGPDRDDVERRAHRLGIARHCLYLGYQEDIARWYAAVDAVILPSANEGTPVSVIEALAAGRPVVATNVGGVPDVVSDGEHGFLVDVGDVEALAERLARLAADPALRERMGAAGRAHVLSRYAVERLVDDVDRLYRSLLAAASEPSGTPRTPASARPWR
ncbi:MAG TPA: glycosyltransferase family 4 protein [Gaiellaceae bacterium]|nr:glycosyltransferase family 4 protein [Gaiellaceae bacterium]